MGLLTAATQVRIISAIHLTLAYLLIFQPDLLDKQKTIKLLGQAMGINDAVYFTSGSARPVSALLGLLFGLFGLSDLVGAGIQGIPFHIHWSGQAPVRLTFFFALAALTYVYDPHGTGSRDTLVTAGLASVKTDWVFTWAFIEIIAWFSIYSTVREEKQAIFIERERERANS